MAEKDKKFYWLKLKSEFMNSEIIDFLMSQKNGANYVVLYQMLALKTINTQGKLCSAVGEVLIPFNIEKIQRDCKWFDIDTIRVALELYSKLGLVYKNQDGIIQIADFEEMVGSETYWAKQKRIQRGVNNVGHSLENVQHSLISNIYNLKSNNISNNNKKFIRPTIEEVKAYCQERRNRVDAERFIDFYESKGWKVGNQAMKDWKACVRTWEKRDSGKKEDWEKENNTKVNLNDLYSDLDDMKW